jgi:hypothetical protein
MPIVRVGRVVAVFCVAFLRGRIVLLFFFKASLLFAPVSALIDLKLQTSIIDWPSHPISGSEKEQAESAVIIVTQANGEWGLRAIGGGGPLF